jgi:hypothetical protein
MKPVMQTRFGKPLGNCWAAAIASILELPLEVTDWAVDMPAQQCLMGVCILHRDCEAAERDFGSKLQHPGYDDDVSPEWNRRREEMLVRIGYWIADGIPPEAAKTIPPDVHYLVYGTTVAGIGHIVVGRAGEIVHDGNPDRPKLAKIEMLGLLVKR